MGINYLNSAKVVSSGGEILNNFVAERSKSRPVLGGCHHKGSQGGDKVVVQGKPQSSLVIVQKPCPLSLVASLDQLLDVRISMKPLHEALGVRSVESSLGRANTAHTR